MLNLDKLKFDEKGLIPAIVVDNETGKVLTLAYMNRESLKISMEKGLTCFFSRSRQELWLKGETSGNYQHIVSITADCDCDALEVRVKKDGPACHTGAESCFHNPILGEKNDNSNWRGCIPAAGKPEERAARRLLHHVPVPEGSGQNSEKGGRGEHRGHYCGQGRGQGGDHL